MPHTLTDAGLAFATERHLATLSTHAADGSIHVVPVGFTIVSGTARIITSGSSQKVRNIRARQHATISQVDGARWLTLVGTGRVVDDAESVAEAVGLYAERYRQPRVNPHRVAILIEITKAMGSRGMIAD
ncbi:MAG: pyridoxamine 5'-phosphate oxidase family protein [Salinibacterium sp.]|nr:pyridoxamine 5'-phosphate oxidase family protein [Salinibacterium sp.]MBF0672902.1 pyridoxamine 5'-phosphate oxidase family protein [Salinibacterium sp.]